MSRFRTAILACFTVSLCILLFPFQPGRQHSVTCASPASAQPEPTEYFVSLADPGQSSGSRQHSAARGQRRAHARHAGMECPVPGSQLRRQCRGRAGSGCLGRGGGRPQDQRPASGRSLRLRDASSSATTFISMPRAVRQRAGCRSRLFQLGHGADVLACLALATDEHSSAGCSHNVGAARPACSGRSGARQGRPDGRDCAQL